jgi:D-glycero-D-manno-heptose 1,7-bisphosphate phosphatase
MHRALFLDRDGVLNQEVGYLHRPEDVLWVEGILPLCLTAQSLGYKLVVVTNQSGIARGLYTEQQFQDLMLWMRAALSRHGGHLDAVYHCPFHPEHGVGDYRREHEDRKPSPGMLHHAARDLDLDLSQSILVGDRCSDLAAANAAGLREAFLLAGTETSPCPQPHTLIDTLKALEEHLKRLEYKLTI